MSDEYVPPPAAPEVLWSPPPPRLKFQHPYRRHILWFLATVVTCTFSLPPYGMAVVALSLSPSVWLTWEVVREGLWYAIPVLTILAAHEFGHYGYCRKYNVDATLPYFIPAPIMTGTLGAVIRIKEPFPSKKALFDIGVAGPIAGFVVLVPFLIAGLMLSKVAPKPPDIEQFLLGEPLLLKGLALMLFDPVPAGSDIFLHPMAFAAWWGLFATAVNLLPFGQLDGGHIAYAVLGRRAGWVSAATLAVVIGLAIVSPTWVLMAVLMTVAAALMGVRHPRIYDEHEPLDGRRVGVALVALAIFVISFTPLPIQAFW